MKDNFDLVFNSSEEIKTEEIKSIKAIKMPNRIFKKLDDYKSTIDDIPKKKCFKLKFSFLKYKSDFYKIIIFVTIVISVMMFISAANNGKFQSSYSNNVTVESDNISCPATEITNEYDFNPTTNVTVEASEVNCNCNCDCNNQSS